MSKTARRRFGVRILVTCSVVLVTAAMIGNGELRTAREIEFEEYSKTFEQAAIAGSLDQIAIPQIQLTISESSQEELRKFVLNHDRPDQILRALVLMRESRLFSLSESVESSIPQPQIELSVTDGSLQFNLKIARSQIVDNIKAETLLKLIEVLGQKKDLASE